MRRASALSFSSCRRSALEMLLLFRCFEGLGYTCCGFASMGSRVFPAIAPVTRGGVYCAFHGCLIVARMAVFRQYTSSGVAYTLRREKNSEK